MNDRHREIDPLPRISVEDEAIHRDLAALDRSRTESLPPLETVMRSARQRAVREGRFMNSVQWMKQRPWMTAGAVAAAIALALLVIPVSYHRTTGQEVTLTFSAPGVGAEDVKDIAGKLKTELDVPAVQVGALDEAGRMIYTLRAFVPSTAKVDAGAVSRGFAAALSAEGYDARALVAPRVERVSGNVYAMAMNRAIRVSVDGKSAAEIETEIRDRLIEAGVPNPEVSVTDEGDKRRVEVKASFESDDPSAVLPEEPVDVVLTKDGQDLGGDAGQIQVRVKKLKSDEGTALHVEISKDGSHVEAVVRSAESLSDEALAAELENQFRAAGLDLEVKVEGGKIEVVPRQ